MQKLLDPQELNMINESDHDRSNASTDRCVKVCDRECGPGRWTGAGFNTTGSDDCLHCELRRETPLTSVTWDLPVPANIRHTCIDMYRCVHVNNEVIHFTQPWEAHPPLHSGRAPEFCLQHSVVSHTLMFSHDDGNHSHCWKVIV